MKRHQITYLLVFTALTMLSSVSQAEDPIQEPSDRYHAAGIAAITTSLTATHGFVQTIRRTRKIDSQIYHNKLELERIQKKSLSAKELERVKTLNLENKALSKDANYAVAKVAGGFIAAGAVPFMVDAIVNGHQVTQNVEKAQATSQPDNGETSAPQTATARAAQ